MALLDAIANNVTTVADGDLFYSAEDLTGSYQDGKVAASVLKSYVLATPLAVRGNGTAGAELRLPEDTDNGSNYVAIKAPDSLSATYTLTLPSDDGSADQYLKTDGSGGLSWATVSGASAPLTLASGTLTDPSAALTITQTWNDAADTFSAMQVSVTNTASADGSKALEVLVGGSTVFSIKRNAAVPCWDISGDGASPYVRLLNANGAEIGYGTNGNVICGISRIGLRFGATEIFRVESANVRVRSSSAFGWASADADSATDTLFYRVAAGIIGVRGADTSSGGALNFLEQTAPSAPSANEVVVYAEDNGSGKTRLMARFNTGAAQVLATEP